MYLQQKCSWAIGNCRQANGDNRHLVPDMPIGLGRDIRDMPIACARTRPDANKHARHIPMYRPVHSGHPNKCSQSVSGSNEPEQQDATLASSGVKIPVNVKMSASMGSSIIQYRSWHEDSGSNEPEQQVQ